MANHNFEFGGGNVGGPCPCLASCPGCGRGGTGRRGKNRNFTSYTRSS